VVSSSDFEAGEFDGEALPLLSSGEVSGFRWELRGAFIGDEVHTWTSMTSLTDGGGGGGGGIGPVPSLVIDGKPRALWALGQSSDGSWRKWYGRSIRPTILDGLATRDVARVRVNFKNGLSQDAILVDSQRAEFRFCALVVPGQWQWTSAVALDSEGRELDRVPNPFLQYRRQIERRRLTGALVSLLLASAIHADWHFARPDHHRLSLGLPWHWLLTIPIFALVAAYVARTWPWRIGAASRWILGSAILLGGVIEPAFEHFVGGAPFDWAFGHDRNVALASFVGTGLVSYLVVLRLMRRTPSNPDRIVKRS
jgi:hypothetical protein